MQQRFQLICAGLGIFLSACSPVNSVAPFDHVQAEILLREQVTTYPAQHLIRLVLPEKQAWKKLTFSPASFIPSKASATNWPAKITSRIYPYSSRTNITADRLAKNAITMLNKECPHNQAILLTRTPQYTVYQINIRDCINMPNQTQWSKAFNGEDAVYLVCYTALTGKVDSDQQAQMAAAIKNATLVRRVR